ncbi:crotonase/enoyl-CoA hydratase family protein [Paenibacillus tarimensis]|uniref:crotonase/enoyl-CoA hydratase family protein n=1 Tax=Paenibacillus tarimensis TaxID=416012 RepID=UPI001F29C6CC|nr:crotonase/enoyl-CoA hydratase family protein [Paenibacillus tarimensis]MCF2943980.1 crotonase/enoyl-CoA hydratase family protein [Paenibacillus tarimensis]
MDYQTIESVIDDHVQLITLNRPERYNTFSLEMAGEIMDALDHADVNEEVRAVVITGRGRIFCAGAELNDGKESFRFRRLSEGMDESTFRDPGGVLALRLFECRKPVIGAINGPAMGVGATFPLAMDVRIASEQAKFGFVFTRRGIVMESCSSWFLPRIVGISRALEWCMSGRTVLSEEAVESGLVRSVHPPEQVVGEALRIAREMTAHTSPVSVALTRQMLWRMMGASHPAAAHEIESKGIFCLGKSDDAREGAAAFFEKREPRFSSSLAEDMPSYYPWWNTSGEGEGE